MYSSPYATALTFGRYLSTPLLEKGAYVARVRHQREAIGGFNPYSIFGGAVRNDLRSGTPGVHVQRSVSTVLPKYAPLYQVLVEGWSVFLAGLRDSGACHYEKVSSATIVRSGLPINVNPHVGMRRPTHEVEVLYLWFDKNRPTAETVNGILRLMDLHMTQIRPQGGVPVIVDVRRGVVHRGYTVPVVKVDQMITGEAAAFAATWAPVAA